MPRAKMQVPEPNERIPIGTPNETRERLAEFVRVKFEGNWTDFARVTGVPVQTVESWKPANRGWPSFQHLQRLAQHRLSLDWIITGSGPMQVERVEARTDAGQLLYVLRPYLQRLARVGETTDDLVFARMLVAQRVDGLMELAAQGLWPTYAEIARDFKRLDESSELRGWLYSEIKQLHRAAEEKSAVEVKRVLSEAMERLAKEVPGYLALSEVAEKRQLQLLAEALRRRRQHETEQLDEGVVASALLVAKELEAAAAQALALRAALASEMSQSMRRIEVAASGATALRNAVRLLLAQRGAARQTTARPRMVPKKRRTGASQKAATRPKGKR